MNEEKQVTVREAYLKKFEIENDVRSFGYENEVEGVAEEIVSLIKEKDLQYVDAYASLEWAYQKLRYESNFTSIR